MGNHHGPWAHETVPDFEALVGSQPTTVSGGEEEAKERGEGGDDGGDREALGLDGRGLESDAGRGEGSGGGGRGWRKGGGGKERHRRGEGRGRGGGRGRVWRRTGGKGGGGRGWPIVGISYRDCLRTCGDMLYFPSQLYNRGGNFNTFYRG